MFDLRQAEVHIKYRTRDMLEEAERERQRFAFEEERKRQKRDATQEPGTD